MKAVGRAAPGALRVLRADLGRGSVDPLSPDARLWMPVYTLGMVLYGIGVAVFGINDLLGDQSRLGTTLGTLLGVCQASAPLVALYRPLTGWWLATVVMAVVAGAGTSAEGAELQPWTGAGLAAQAAALFLLALRIRARATAEALLLGVLTGLACVPFAPPGTAPADVARACAVLGTVAVVGAALRGVRTARTELVAQEEITAEERSRRALLEERNRIARELHDVVAHHMSVISIQAQVAPHLVENPPEELRENLTGIRENAVEALAELRRVLGVLRSEDAAADGVRHAPQPTLDRLDELVEPVRGAGVEVTTEVTGEPRPLSPGVGLSAYRIVQEALSNALRHAPGAAVRVEIGHRPAGVSVRVANTAPTRGPGSPSPPGAGHGLLGMRERVAMLGGELATGATPDGGYEVTALLPTTPVKEFP
ncbi:sensor histidine kinase [Streptomyces sp. NPDC048172]|uniref:sensor histidine kinase n=1 Tax=Streptomyces sp. NPDC048172 TaxID=3365505 RepID=UPI003710941E